MVGHNTAALPRSVSEFMALPMGKASEHYVAIRRGQRLVEQLSDWVAASIAGKQGETDQGHWRELCEWMSSLEEHVVAANKSIDERHWIQAAPHYVRFLVTASGKAAIGCDLTKDGEILDLLLKMFPIEDWRRPSLPVIAHTLCKTKVIGRAVVPVAFVEKGSGKGLLAHLEVEAFEKGPKVMAINPTQTFESPRAVEIMSQLKSSLETAFLAGANEAKVELCGRWRLLEWDGERPMPSPLDGPSLGAAAARAWAFALQGQKADPRVLAIAQANESGKLLSLEDNAGVAAKVAQTCELTARVDPLGPNAIDTIVVVGVPNRNAAQSAIDSAKAGSRIQVVMLEESESNNPVSTVA